MKATKQIGSYTIILETQEEAGLMWSYLNLLPNQSMEDVLTLGIPENFAKTREHMWQEFDKVFSLIGSRGEGVSPEVKQTTP